MRGNLAGLWKEPANQERSKSQQQQNLLRWPERRLRDAQSLRRLGEVLRFRHGETPLTRSEIDRLEAFVKKELGAKGLAWIRVMPNGKVSVATGATAAV